METPEFWNTWEKIKPLAEKINSKDIEKAIKWANEQRDLESKIKTPALLAQGF